MNERILPRHIHGISLPKGLGCCLLAFFFACADDGGKSKRGGGAAVTTPAPQSPSPQVTDPDAAKKACFDQKNREAVAAGRQPDNITIYEECGFFKGEFEWREAYLACKESGKLWDGKNRACSTHPADSGVCTYDSLKERWVSEIADFAALVDGIDAEGFQIDQCGTVGGNPHVVFVKPDEAGETIKYRYIP